ncbi:MAG: VTT domain-containing protein [Patulibacter sp.]
MLSALITELSTPLALMPNWLSPEHILEKYGFIAILIIIFAETGLLIGFFLPGDTLLFSAGILTEVGTISEPLWLLMIAVPIAAIAGNLVGYEIGHRAGPALFTREKSRLLNKEHLDRTHAFFVKYGPITIFLARFVPIVRTFAAVVAGAVGMDRRIFIIWSVIGAVAWTSGLILLGYVVASILPDSAVDFIQSNIDFVIIGVVLLTIGGIVAESILHKRKTGKSLAEPGDLPPADAE